VEQPEQLTHLERLAVELIRRKFHAEVITRDRRPCLLVANPDLKDLTELVFCQPADDGTWCFWWSWQHPIGPVDDLDTATRRIMTVLRSVEGES
jgi:hypothetical protein